MFLIFCSEYSVIFFFHKSCHLNLGPFYDHHDFNRHHVGKNENQGKFSFSFYPSDIYLIKFKHTSSNLKSTSTGGSLPSGRKGIKINIVICFFEGSYVKWWWNPWGNLLMFFFLSKGTLQWLINRKERSATCLSLHT
jgi:hypothetical protein